MIANSLREYWPVHLLLLFYTLVLAYHAWHGNRSTKGLADYYVGGRNMGGITIALSFFATYSSTNSFVGFSGQSWSWGAPWLLLAPFIVLFSLTAWIWVAPRLRDFTAGLDSLTIPDFIGFRFESTAARVLAAFIIIFASFFYMTAVFKGIGNLLEAFLEIPYRAAILVVFLIVMLYTVIGGFISVVKTDAVQGVVMIVAGLLLFLGTTRAAGGIGSIFELADAPETAHLFTWNGGEAFPLVLGVIVAATIKFIVEPRQLSRFYALRSRREVRRGVWLATVTLGVVYAMLVPIGMYARRVLPAGLEDTDLVVPGLLTEPGVFAPGVGAFLLVAMVAAAMSSLDSVLLVMASTCQRDIFGVWRGQGDERSAMKRTKWYVALFAAITAVISLNPPAGVVSLTAFSGAMYAACFFPALILGLHWRRGNGTSAVTSFAVGLGVLVIWRLTPPLSSVLHEVFPALGLSLLAYVLVARLTSPPTAPHKVETLFKKAARQSRRRARR